MPNWRQVICTVARSTASPLQIELKGVSAQLGILLRPHLSFDRSMEIEIKGEHGYVFATVLWDILLHVSGHRARRWEWSRGRRAQIAA